MPKIAGKIVEKVDPDMDRRDILYTTYQMRNPFKQFADGVAGELDVHCYFQHCSAADLCPDGGIVLDVCCGRGLLIPFLRYRAKPSGYIGVDACPENAKWRLGMDPRQETREKTDWGFSRTFIESEVSVMAQPIMEILKKRWVDLIVYTSAIEHMQPEAQRLSLLQCAQVSRRGTFLYLSCPVTEEGNSGYDAQYAAHIYEPQEKELRTWLEAAGWKVTKKAGLCTKASTFKAILTGPALAMAERIYDLQPRELSLCTIAALFPQAATEIALTCRKT